MANKVITLSTPQSLGVEATDVEIRWISLASDESGTWDISVTVNTTIPDRPPNDDVDLTERYSLTAKLSVSRAEVAADQGIEESEVKTSLNLEEMENVVTSIALTKLFGVVGLTLEDPE